MFCWKMTIDIQNQWCKKVVFLSLWQLVLLHWKIFSFDNSTDNQAEIDFDHMHGTWAFVRELKTTQSAL